jgi:flagellum-specific peptidoglycan hydrolase FlgJ
MGRLHLIAAVVKGSANVTGVPASFAVAEDALESGRGK